MKTVEIPNVSTRVKTTNEECKRVRKALKLSGYICSFVRLRIVRHNIGGKSSAKLIHRPTGKSNTYGRKYASGILVRPVYSVAWI